MLTSIIIVLSHHSFSISLVYRFKIKKASKKRTNIRFFSFYLELIAGPYLALSLLRYDECTTGRE